MLRIILGERTAFAFALMVLGNTSTRRYDLTTETRRREILFSDLQCGFCQIPLLELLWKFIGDLFF
jgi:hypothetical protein